MNTTIVMNVPEGDTFKTQFEGLKSRDAFAKAREFAVVHGYGHGDYAMRAIVLDHRRYVFIAVKTQKQKEARRRQEAAYLEHARIQYGETY